MEEKARTPLRKKNPAAAVIAAAILLFSFAAEWVYSSVTKKDAEAYPRISSGADAFLPAEFESAGNGAYTALANDSHFTLPDAGGIRAESIDIRMRREAGDATETVVYFTGRSRGVEGTFVAGIEQIGDGLYRAEGRFDRVDSIALYPTETAGTSIWFGGAEWNAAFSPSGFSGFRLPLWAFLLPAAAALVSLIRTARNKQRQTAVWRKAYLILGAFAALAAFAVSDLYTSARRIGPALIPLALAAFTALFLFVWLVAVKIRKRHVQVFLLFLFAASAFAFAAAPLQVPDESIHFARAYAIASGSFGFDGEFAYPDDVEWLYRDFPGELGNRIAAGEANALARTADYLSHADSPFPGERTVFSNALLILPYLPSALGVFLVKLSGGNALFALFAGRLANALAAALAAAFAVKKAARFRTPLLAVIFFPLTVFMAASCSYDSMLLAALFLFLGVFCSDEIRARDFLTAALAFAVIAMIKPLYLLLAALIPLIPKERFRMKRRNPLLLTLVLLLAGIALWQLSLLYADLFSSGVTPAAVLPRVDKTAQLQFILNNPFAFLTAAVTDGFRKSFYLGEFGLFGHLDLSAPLTSLSAIPVLLFASALAAGEAPPRSPAEKKRGIRQSLLFAALIPVFYFAVSAAFYIQDSVLGSSTILGIQARYFIPSVFFASALAAAFFSRFLRPKKPPEQIRTVVTWTFFAFALLAALETLSGYYL